MVPLLFLLVGAALGGAVAWLARGHELAAARARLDERERAAQAQQAADEARRAADEAQRASERARFTETLHGTDQALRDAFKALSQDALRENGKAFLERAQAELQKAQAEQKGDYAQAKEALEKLVSPVGQALEKLDAQLHGLELRREGAYAKLTEQVVGLVSQTRGLADALRRPEVRGRWGELQLLRVLELSGMKERCDFDTQVTLEGGVRPDVVVRLPGGKNLAVDSKAPLMAYLEASEAQAPELRTEKLQEHARLVRRHVEQLSAKAYWEKLSPSPELVVLFLPGEAFFSAAVQVDPGLVEWAFERRIAIASPTTLLTLLKAVAQGWREEAVARDARAIRDLGAELYNRLCSMGGHLARVGQRLKGSVEAYNDAMGSMEGRVLVTARKLEELHAAPAGETLPELATVDALPRELTSDELRVEADA
ncbi:MAG: DNA recombination protein RmuC [Deltaproteobacteria bacterium]